MDYLARHFDPLAQRLGMTLVHSLWQGAATAILLAILLRFLRDASSSLRYLFSCAAMICFVASVAVTFAALSPKQPRQPAENYTAMHRARPVTFTTEILPTLDEPAAASSAIGPIRLTGFSWLIGAFIVALWNLGGWLWICGSLSGRELDDHTMITRLSRQLNISRPVRLVESARLNVPAVIGALRPVILVPIGLLNDLSPEQVEAILIHELAHIRRHDYLVNLMQVLVESLLFYHPATWWISSQIRQEREHCCDDVAASRSTARSYVEALLALEQRRWPGALVAATSGSLLERTRRLMGRSPEKKWLTARSGFAVAMALACIEVSVLVNGCNKANSSSVPPTTAATTAPANLRSSGVDAGDLQPDESVERIGTGDLLEITVNDLMASNVEATKRVIVSASDGTVTLPVLGAVRVAGMTESEAQRAIVKAFRDAQIISNATVSVMRVEARSTTYTVLGGGVGKPGDYPILSPGLRLTAALAGADVNFEGQKSIVIVRRVNQSATRTMQISVSELLAGNPGANVAMRPGDIVILPPSDRPAVIASSQTPPAATVDHGEFWIGGGSIQRVGVYQLAEGMTLRQAIISAGGLTEGYIRVFRRDGERRSLIVDNAVYSNLESGAMRDLLLHPGDTILVNPTAQQWKAATTRQIVVP